MRTATWIGALLVFGLATTAAARPTPGAPSTPEQRAAAWQQHQRMEAASPFRGLGWRSIGPTEQGGRVMDFASVPGQPYTYYVAYATGGVWKTTNDGGSFEPLTDHLPNTVVGAIAVDPSAPETLWVGSGEPSAARSNYGGHGVFVSRDGGKTFAPKGLAGTDRIASIVVDPRDGRRVLVAAAGKLYSPGGQRGVFLTEDGGETWTHVLVPSNDWTGASDLVIDPSRPDVLYAALWDRQRAPWQFTEAGDGSGIHKSTDGGRTWRRLDGGLPQGDTVGRIGLAVARSRPDTVYATIEHWAPLPEALQDLGDRPLSPQRLKAMSREEFLAQDPAEIEGFIRGADLPVELDAKTLLDGVRDGSITLPMLISRLEDGNAALFDNPTWGHTVWRTDDGGSTWRRTHDTPIREVTYSYGYYFAEVAVDPSDAERVYTMGVPLIVSSDGGKTWEGYANHPSVHVDHHSLWIDPNHPQRLLLGNDGGLDVSHDRGVTWRKLDAQPVGQFYTIYADMAEPYNVYGGLQDNGTWRGSSRTRWELGEGWSFLNGGDGMWVAVDDESGDTYTGYQFGYYTRIDREGRRHDVRPRAPLADPVLRYNWSTPVILSPHDARTVYMAANRLYRSFDRGRSWTAISPDLTRSTRRGTVPFATITTVSESPLHFGRIGVGTDDGHVHVTRDGGARWQQVDARLPADRWVSRVELSRHAEERLYLALNGYRQDDDRVYLYRSDDFGKSWTSIAAGLPSEPVNVIREDTVNPDVLYVGTDRGVYVSLDRGQAWQALDGGLPNVPVHDLFVHPRDRELIAGTHGRSAWVVDVLPVQQLDATVRASAVHLFHIDGLQASRDWRRRPDPWFDRPEHLPELRGTFWAKQAGTVQFRLLDAKDRPLAQFERAAIDGLNSFAWDLQLDASLVAAAEKQALEALAADQRGLRQNQPYAESIRLGHRLYPVPGRYTLEVAHAGVTHRSAFDIEAPKAPTPRWTPPFKLRGDDEGGRTQNDERPHPRAGARGRPFAMPGK
ncbi:MAG: VPS10 domain-containing protein [Lysobacteraceae bacterium]